MNVRIGKIVAVNGLKGEVILEHNLGKRSELKGLLSVMIETKKDELIPYFVETAKARSATESILKFEGVDTPEKAKLITRKNAWIAEKDFDAHVSKQSSTALLGYILFDKKIRIGEITAVLEQQQQILCTVEINGKEALIPVHSDNTLHMNSKERTIEVDIPDGLLEIYLEE